MQIRQSSILRGACLPCYLPGRCVPIATPGEVRGTVFRKHITKSEVTFPSQACDKPAGARRATKTACRLDYTSQHPISSHIQSLIIVLTYSGLLTCSVTDKPKSVDLL